MATTLYCRFCGYTIEAHAGVIPAVCAGCARESLWMTERPLTLWQDHYRFTAADLRDIARLHEWGRGLMRRD